MMYGCDEEGVELSGPGPALWRLYDRNAFMAMCSVMDGMTLSVRPCDLFHLAQQDLDAL